MSDRHQAMPGRLHRTRQTVRRPVPTSESTTVTVTVYQTRTLTAAGPRPACLAGAPAGGKATCVNRLCDFRMHYWAQVSVASASQPRSATNGADRRLSTAKSIALTANVVTAPTAATERPAGTACRLGSLSPREPACSDNPNKCTSLGKSRRASGTPVCVDGNHRCQTTGCAATEHVFPSAARAHASPMATSVKPGRFAVPTGPCLETGNKCANDENCNNGNCTPKCRRRRQLHGRS